MRSSMMQNLQQMVLRLDTDFVLRQAQEPLAELVEAIKFKV